MIEIIKMGQLRNDVREIYRALEALKIIIHCLGDSEKLIFHYGEIPVPEGRIDGHVLRVDTSVERIGIEVIADKAHVNEVYRKLKNLKNQRYLDKALIIILPLVSSKPNINVRKLEDDIYVASLRD